MEASIKHGAIGPWGSGAIRRFLTELGELFQARFALAPDMVREPAWWDEVGVDPVPSSAVSRRQGRVRMEQTEFWSTPSTSAPEPVQTVSTTTATVIGPSSVSTPASSADPAGHTTISPPKNHDRPSAPPSGVGDMQGVPAPMRPVVAPFRKVYAERTPAAPRASMARYLRLNGMLQDERDLLDGMELPRQAFRARCRFLMERRLPMDRGRESGGRFAWTAKGAR